MEHRELTLPHRGVGIHVKLDLPEGAEGGPLALVIHGLTGHMEERHILAACGAFHRRGIGTLRADMYGHGASEGDFSEHNLFIWLDQVMALTDYAQGLSKRLYISGHSQGGLAALLSAGMRPDAYEKAVLLAPALNILDGARKGDLLGRPFDPQRIPNQLPFDHRPLSGTYLRCAQLLDGAWAIDHYSRPVLLVHGSGDDTVPLACSEWAAARYQHAALTVLPDDTHCFDLHLTDMAAAIEGFLA